MKERKIYWLNHAIELLVVFLGVTASFVLLNINEERGTREFEQKFIEGFESDVSENIEQLKEQISLDSTWLADNTYAIQSIVNESLSRDSASALAKGMMYFSKFTAQTTTYLNLINSGNLGIIRDHDLRQQLVSYQKELEDSEILEEYFHNHVQRNFIPFLIHHYDMFRQELITRDIHNKPSFVNLFGTHYSFTQQRLEVYRELLDHSESILGKIEEFK